MVAYLPRSLLPLFFKHHKLVLHNILEVAYTDDLKRPLITYEEGVGGLEYGKIASLNCLRPLQDRVTILQPLLLQSGNTLCPPFSMAKTSSSCVKATPKRVVPPPPFRMAKTFSLKLHLPTPLSCCSPRSP